MKLSQTREAILREFEEKFGTDIYRHTPGYWNGDIAEPAHDEHISAEIADHLTQALNDYTESIVRMVEERAKEVEKKQKTMLENDERDRNTYQRTGLKTDYDRVVLNEGTTAHLNAGRLMGKIEALNDIKEALNDTK